MVLFCTIDFQASGVMIFAMKVQKLQLENRTAKVVMWKPLLQRAQDMNTGGWKHYFDRYEILSAGNNE